MRSIQTIRSATQPSRCEHCKKERANMLPYDKRPWAGKVAATVILLTLVAAVCVPIVLHQRKALDPPILVGIVLLLLAIVPPNVVVLRRSLRGDRQNNGKRLRESMSPAR
jgi:hypothetical protein